MDQVNLTLAEQLEISPGEIQRRKALLSFTQEDVALLRQCRTLIEPDIEQIAREFYEFQLSFLEIQQIIGDAETLRRLQGSMRQYILELFCGQYDQDYINKRLRIGKVHQQIGVSSKLYLAGIFHLQQLLCRHIENRLLQQQQLELANDIRLALNKVITFDTQLVFDTYIISLMSRAELAHKQLEDYIENLEDIVRDRTKQLEEASKRDLLTGLYNQRGFFETMRHELAMAERYQEPLTLCFFDLDGFKQVNDDKGHIHGDKVLACIGQSMLDVVRETDYPCRYGGDEFAIILPRSTVQEATRVADRLIEIFKHQCKEEVTFSVGIATTGPDEYVDADTLLELADAMMYRAKDQSRQQYGFHIVN